MRPARSPRSSWSAPRAMRGTRSVRRASPPRGETERLLADTPASLGQKEFPCRQCGAKLAYLPGSRVQKCAHCSFENPIPQSEEEVRELDYRAFLAEATGREEKHETVAVKCSSCGAETSLPDDTTASECPFCGSSIVATRASRAVLKPRALLPFRIARPEAIAAFQVWLRARWFAPSGLRRFAEASARLQGVYVPYWT